VFFKDLPEPTRPTTPRPVLSLYGIIYVTWYTSGLPEATGVRLRLPNSHALLGSGRPCKTPLWFQTKYPYFWSLLNYLLKQLKSVGHFNRTPACDGWTDIGPWYIAHYTRAACASCVKNFTHRCPLCAAPLTHAAHGHMHVGNMPNSNDRNTIIITRH